MANFVLPIYIDYAGKMRRSRSTADLYSATTRLVMKRGDNVRLAVYYLDQNTNLPFALSPGAIVQAAMKPKGKYDSSVEYTCYGSTNINPTNASDPAYYVTVPLTGDALNDLMGVDGESEDDPAYIDLLFEISWSEDYGVTWSSSTDVVEARVHNDIIRAETETPALPPPPPEGFSVFPVYKKSVSFLENGSGTITVNLRTLFDVKVGQIAHFRINSVCTRRLDMEGENPPPTATYGLGNIDIAKAYAAIDLSSTSNYAAEPAISNVYDEYDGNEDLGQVQILVKPNTSVTDGVYLHYPLIDIEFSHITESTYSHIDLIGTVLVELIAIHTPAIV